MQEPSKAGQSPGPAYDLSHTMTRHARRSLMVLTPVPASIKGPRVDCHCTCSLPSSVPPSHPPFLALRRRQGSQGLLSAATTASSCEYSPKLGLLRPPLGYTPLDVVCHCRPAHPQKRHLPLYLHTISKSPNACPSTSPMTSTSSSPHATRPTRRMSASSRPTSITASARHSFASTASLETVKTQVFASLRSVRPPESYMPLEITLHQYAPRDQRPLVHIYDR